MVRRAMCELCGASSCATQGQFNLGLLNDRVNGLFLVKIASAPRLVARIYDLNQEKLILHSFIGNEIASGRSNDFELALRIRMHSRIRMGSFRVREA